MALALTYNYYLNHAMSDISSVTRQMASMLLNFVTDKKAAGWTVVQSSDGTNYSTDGTDRWTDASKITVSPQSWCTLRSPAGFYPGTDGSYSGYIYITIFPTATTTVSVRIHNVLPTGGSATTPASSANQLSWTGIQASVSDVTKSQKTNLIESTSKGGTFIVTVPGMSYPGAFCIGMWTIANATQVNGSAYPYDMVFYVGGAFTTNGVFSSSGLFAANTLKCWDVNNVATTATIYALRDASGNLLGSQYPNTGSDMKTSSSNPTGEMPLLGMYVSTDIPSKTYPFGYIADLRLVGVGASNSNPTTDGLRQKIGAIEMPYDGSTLIQV